MAIRALVWGENVHERRNRVVAQVYPHGMHQTIADALNTDSAIRAETATLDQPGHGITPQRLAQTDVLLWWGHAAHGDVSDAVTDMVCNAVWSGMGAIFLHSAHFSKPFK
ncbi:MAG: ThuA domain-containing protein, partial [Cereibacter sp.]